MKHVELESYNQAMMESSNTLHEETEGTQFNNTRGFHLTTGRSI
jgi:hypothetical protein